MDHIDIVFDGPPGHEAGRFVEVENAAGASINFGEWVERADGYWVLRIPAPGMTVAEMVAAVDACREALFAKGYEKPYVKIEYMAAPHRGGPAWFIHASDPSTTPSRKVAGQFGASAAEALGYLRAAVEDAPHIWSPADVAATLGLPICELCDEAVATHDLSDNPYRVVGMPERVCEPCLERAADRAVERAMEG